MTSLDGQHGPLAYRYSKIGEERSKLGGCVEDLAQNDLEWVKLSVRGGFGMLEGGFSALSDVVYLEKCTRR